MYKLPNMKNIFFVRKQFLLLFYIIFIVPSCSKFLEENPKNFINTDNFFQTEQDAISSVNSIYAYLNSQSAAPFTGTYHSTFWAVIGLASDELRNGNVQLNEPDMEPIGNFTFSALYGEFAEIWQQQYKPITQANLSIEKIPAIKMDETLKARLIGEASFLRGLLYFNMVRMFGSIPLVLKAEEPLKPPVATEDEIYNQIIADLTVAINSLPDNYPPKDGRGRATKGAANALLAKVLLTRGDWQGAVDHCMAVINGGQYDLWQDFADVFKLSSRGGKESVFAVGFGTANNAISFWEAGQFQVRLLPPQIQAEGIINCQGWQYPTVGLHASFDPLDRRRNATFGTTANGNTIDPYIIKYWDRKAEPKGGDSQNDFQVIRYSDVFLTAAEAYNELGDSAEAKKYINTVRKRARWDGTKYQNVLPDITGLTQAQFRDTVLNERKWEFVCEGQRWFDLKRTNKLEEIVPQTKPTISPEAKNYLFPKPQREIDLNGNIIQNTGY